MKSLETHRQEARAYMQNCTDSQLQGVIDLETERLRRCSEGEVADVARIMRDEARQEQRRRRLR
jgi:hypothetical protein